MGTVYNNDIFISYAKDDDLEMIPNNPQSRWVSSFADYLSKTLIQELGERVKIWQDIEDFEGNQRYDEIFENLSQSALFLIILTPRYLNRAWCKNERIEFFKSVGSAEAALKRTLLVRANPIPEETLLPDELKDTLGYRFFDEDKGVRYGTPSRMQPDYEYYQAFIDLCKDATHLVRRLNRESSAEAGRTVFLAESHQILRTDRVYVDDRLTNAGFQVFPNRFYELDRSAFCAAMRSDLSKCSLFIQLLSEKPFELDRPQWEEAVNSGVGVLRWRRKDLNLSSLTDENHRNLLNSADIFRDDLEVFLSIIFEQLRKEEIVETLPKKESEAFVLVKIAPGDTSTASHACGELQDRGVDFEVLTGETTLKDAAENGSYTGLVVTVGQRSVDWARSQLRGLRQLALGRQLPPPACAAYRDDSDCLVPINFKGLRILPDHWDQFIDDIQSPL